MSSIAMVYKLVKYISLEKTMVLSLNHVKHLLSPNYTRTQYRSLSVTVKHYNKKVKPLSSSSVIVQDGISILDMPCIVQVINGDFEILNDVKTESGHSYEGLRIQCHNPPKTSFKNIDFVKEAKMAIEFTKCSSVQEIFHPFNTCPDDEITPTVALAVIRKIFDLERKFKCTNEAYNLQIDDINLTYTKTAIIKHFIEVICESTEPQVIVDTLKTMGKDPNVGNNWNYAEHLCNECIILASDGKLTVNQICEIIKAFQKLGHNGKEYAEKAWIGINENQNLNRDEICNIMTILPLVKNSRMYLFNIVERKMPLICHIFNINHIMKIADGLIQLKISSPRILSMISRWTNLNIHTLSEKNLKLIVYTCMHLEYTDENIQKALSRYMKIKKENIKDYSLVFTILEYCHKMRIKHPVILSTGSEYYIKHGKGIPACHTSTIMNCFGNLAYIPENAHKFFNVVDHQINTNFSQFFPPDLLNVFLSYMYIEKYPLNFVNFIFNSSFFDRILALKDSEFPNCRENMMIIDTVMTLESPSYRGPLLPKLKLSELKIKRDARVTSCAIELKRCLSTIFESKNIFCFQLLPLQHPVSLFSIDCVVESWGKFKFLSFWMKKNKYAFLIHIPEHFDSTGSYLLGPQALRKRVLEHFNFKVISLRYKTVEKLIGYPEKLKDYLKAEMEKVL